MVTARRPAALAHKITASQYANRDVGIPLLDGGTAQAHMEDTTGSLVSAGSTVLDVRVVVAVVILAGGLALAACSGGPSQGESAACGPILKITIPAAIAREKTNEAVSISNALVANFIHSGNAKLAHYGHTLTHPGSAQGFASAFNSAKAECRAIGA